jgi:hypothetical protein
MFEDNIVKTSKGYPAIWESGGGMTNTGTARIVCGPNGEKLKPVYIRKKGQLSCSTHALFLLKHGIYVIEVDRHNDEYTMKIAINNNGVFEEVENIPFFLDEAIKAAREKTRHYHCRNAYYFLKKEDTCDNETLIESTSI